jgi:hypothetical protein
MIGLLLMMAMAWALESEVSVSARLDGGVQGSPDTVIVSVEYPRGYAVELGEPAAEGLTFSRVGEVAVERAGGLVLERHAYRFSGASGSYELAPINVEWSAPEGEGVAASYSLFIDHQVEAKPPGELVDIIEPEIQAPAGWAAWFVGGGLLGLFAAGVFWAFFAKPKEVDEEAPEGPPAHEVALARWKAVLADASMSVEEKAIELSALFRDYLEAQLRFAATAWTTTETMTHLRELAYLEAEQLQSAKRILRATDWVKYAEAATPEESLRALDSDLRGFIDATRPHEWRGEA